MSRESENPMEALVRDFYKGIEVKLQAKTGWGRNEVLEVVRDVQVHVLARHLAHTTAQLYPRRFELGRATLYTLDTSDLVVPVVESKEPPWTP